MAITTSAPNGVIVTTAAINESLGSQTQQTGSNTVVVSDTIVVLSNGNLVTSPVYIDRLCIIRQGLSNEETRLITADAAGTGTTRILTVSEDWLTVPASSDTIHVTYIIQDAATVNGLNLINKRVQDFSSSRRFTVGNGTDFAYFSLLFGASLETVDNSSTTVADFTVDNNGRFDNGYIQDGNPVSGGQLFLTPAVNGELAFEMIAGGEINWFNHFDVAITRPAFNILAATTGKVRMINFGLIFGINDFRLGEQDTDINGLYLESDDTGTTPRCQVRDIDTGNEIKNIRAVNFNGFESVTSGDDPVLRNIAFIRMSKLCTIATAETWTIVNSIMTIATGNQNDVSIAGTGELLRQFEFRNFSHDLTDVALTAKHYVIDAVHRGGSGSLANEDIADSGGLSRQDVETERYVDNGGTALTLTTSSNFAEISAEYGFSPIIKNITPENEDETVFPTLFGKAIDYAHSVDDFQVEGTAATARTLGDDTNNVQIEKQATNPASIIKYTGGTGTLTVGATVNGDTSTATGVVVEILEGDSVAGTVLLDSRNATVYTVGGEGLTETGGGADWTGTLTASSELRYTWLIDARTLTIQQLYDYLNAKLDESSLDTATPTFFDTILIWAIDGTNALPLIGDSTGVFKTVRESTKSEGWAIYNFTGGIGAISAMTSDGGTQFVPATTVTLTIHCERKDDNTDIQNVQIIIKKVSDGSEVDSGVTNASGDFTSSFTFTSDVDVTIDARKSTLPIPRFFAEDAANTIVSTGMTQNFLMVEDTIAVQA